MKYDQGIEFFSICIYPIDFRKYLFYLPKKLDLKTLLIGLKTRRINSYSFLKLYTSIFICIHNHTYCIGFNSGD